MHLIRGPMVRCSATIPKIGRCTACIFDSVHNGIVHIFSFAMKAECTRKNAL